MQAVQVLGQIYSKSSNMNHTRWRMFHIFHSLSSLFCLDLFFFTGKIIKKENSHTDTMVAVQGHLELILLSKDIHSTLGSK